MPKIDAPSKVTNFRPISVCLTRDLGEIVEWKAGCDNSSHNSSQAPIKIEL